MMATEEATWHAAPPLVRAVSCIGSGDSLFAGLATGLLGKQKLLRIPAACHAE
ncbi:hypothetical protein [Candidatus Viridilinea mediisalina]|uniref:Carbohydrate kinase PfkB domain-containing protein n=1 Tax=Candidatus Viridilinea mediisalina TaxID=2024553 RepID=A0A2A6RN51_9CHLR|nr:hypothetical protein CJ255_03085 [Candidatus Viridilinea mediisalina]